MRAPHCTESEPVQARIIRALARGCGLLVRRHAVLKLRHFPEPGVLGKDLEPRPGLRVHHHLKPPLGALLGLQVLEGSFVVDVDLRKPRSRAWHPSGGVTSYSGEGGVRTAIPFGQRDWRRE